MITVRGLSHRFDTQIVLRDISLRIAERERVAIMGTSGGGKTTLLRCMAGLLLPTEGTVELFGQDFYQAGEQEQEDTRRRLGVVFQNAALFDYLSVRDNVVFGVIRRKSVTQEEVDDIVARCLKLVGLEDTEEKMPAELSGGMRKRVGLARALASEPEILFYDEPTSGLDPVTSYAIDGLIVEVAEETGATSVVVTHELNSMLRTAHRAMFLSDGTILADLPPEEFINSDEPVIREMVARAKTEAREA